jgi:hypothetical protein
MRTHPPDNRPTAGIFWIVTVFWCRSRVKIRGQIRQTFPDEHERMKMMEKSDTKEKSVERKNNLCQPYSTKQYPVMLQGSPRISFLQLHAIRTVIIFPSLAPFSLRPEPKRTLQKQKRMEVRTRTEST